MDCLYDLGVTIIETFQEWLADYDGYFELVNNISNPNHTLEILFPLISIIDSVFAAQLVLCMAFGGWLNAVMKWWLLEDRPYWWVQETDYYADSQRPLIQQTSQTCETGPGCPSGHSESAAMLAMLTLCWLSHYVIDCKVELVSWWKWVWYPLCGFWLASVMVARIFVGTHFPHQVMAGAALGGFLAPFLCIYVTDPFIWQYGCHTPDNVGTAVFWHVVSVVIMVVISVVTYFSMTWFELDPQWTLKLAFRWCEFPEAIHVSTTPMYGLAHCTGHLMGWALSVTPSISVYRHYTKNRSLIISTFVTAIIVYSTKTLQNNISRDRAALYYILLFNTCALKVPLLLRVMPCLSMWPYTTDKKKKKH